jgi:hypothetical protein
MHVYARGRLRSRPLTLRYPSIGSLDVSILLYQISRYIRRADTCMGQPHTNCPFAISEFTLSDEDWTAVDLIYPESSVYPCVPVMTQHSSIQQFAQQEFMAAVSHSK